jgi:hypothetical protein
MQVDFLERETGVAAPAAPLRKAAMLLHSMAESDRGWMLARVDQAQRPRLEALLAELAALDFPIDANLVRESLSAVGTKVVTPLPRPADLSGWSVDDAAQVLVSEPDDVIALLLRAGDWPWAVPLRARLGPERTRTIEASPYSTAPQVSAVLLDAATKAAWSRFLALQQAPGTRRGAGTPATTRRAP